MEQMTLPDEMVYLVHGLGGSQLDMWPIARRLRLLGYKVKNWGYRTLRNRIEAPAHRLVREILELARQISKGQSSASTIHLVTHSTGEIIARAMLKDFNLLHLGRVVMLAPPHQASHLARKLTPFFGWLAPSLGSTIFIEAMCRIGKPTQSPAARRGSAPTAPAHRGPLAGACQICVNSSNKSGSDSLSSA